MSSVVCGLESVSSIRRATFAPQDRPLSASKRFGWKGRKGRTVKFGVESKVAVFGVKLDDGGFGLSDLVADAVTFHFMVPRSADEFAESI